MIKIYSILKIVLNDKKHIKIKSVAYIYCLKIIYVYVYFACMHVCVPCACLVPTKTRMELYTLELEIQKVLSHHVDAVNQT